MEQEEKKQEGQNQTIYIQQAPPANSNGLGTAGFVLALLGFIFCWVPVLNWILWILGVIFSLVGVFKKPKGLAIAGLVISFIGLILLIILIVFFWGAIATAAMV